MMRVLEWANWFVSNAKGIMATRNAAALLFLILSAAEGCTEELISFSECLPYVSYPPNNLTESASDKCCDAFSSAVESVCLCYLVRDPLILGFPLNNTRLLSLSSLCSSTSTSFPFLCSSSESSSALPPLNSAPTQTLGSSAANLLGAGGGGGRGGGGAGGARGGGGSGGGSRGKGTGTGSTVPIFSGTGFHHHSSNASSTLITFLFSQFLPILVTFFTTSRLYNYC